MAYKSFQLEHNKLYKTWNKTEDNKNDITTNIKILETDFKSTQFNKKIMTVELLKDFVITSEVSTRHIATKIFEFTNLNNDLVANSKVLIDLKPLNPKFEFKNVRLSIPIQDTASKIGDATFFARNNWFWQKSGELWRLYIRLFAQASVVESIGEFQVFFSNQSKVQANVKLIILSERNLNAVQSIQ